MPDTDFEPQLRVLLTRAASDIGPDADIAPGVRAQLAHPSRLPITIRAIRQPRRIGAALSASAIAALLLVVLLVLGPGLRGRPGPTGTATATIPPTVTIPPPQAQDVTLTYDSSYADAGHTFVWVHLSLKAPAGYPGYSWDVSVDKATLTDSQGHVFPLLAGGPPNVQTVTPNDVSGLLFAPLPAGELGSAQAMTFQASRMLYIVTPPYQAGRPGEALTGPVNGSWKLTFELRPSSGAAITLHDQAQTHSGITVQPLALEVASQSDPVGLEGAARIIVRVTGLPADASVSDVADGFGTALMYSDGSGSSGGNPNLLLTPQGGQPQEPGFVVPIGADTVPLARTQPVGQRGTVELELLFFGPLHATQDSNTGTLTFDSIQLAGQTQPLASGPWVFPIPISAHPLT